MNKKIKRTLLITAIIIILSAFLYYFFYRSIRLDYSEGSCVSDSECIWAGEGCGGGYGVCTDNPKKYEGIMSTCDINFDFPANKGYKCGCVGNLQKCGWKR